MIALYELDSTDICGVDPGRDFIPKIISSLERWDVPPMFVLC